MKVPPIVPDQDMKRSRPGHEILLGKMANSKKKSFSHQKKRDLAMSSPGKKRGEVLKNQALTQSYYYMKLLLVYYQSEVRSCKHSRTVCASYKHTQNRREERKEKTPARVKKRRRFMLKDIFWRLFTFLVKRYGYPMKGIRGEIALRLLRMSY